MRPDEDDEDDAETHVFRDAKVVAETTRAVKVVDSDGVEFWCPKSVIHDDSEVWEPGTDTGKFIVQGWWAKKNNLA